MSTEIIRRPATPSGLSRREEAAVLEGILAHDRRLTPRQRKRLVASVMAHRSIPAAAPQATARSSSPAAMLLQPGVVQAEALALNYGLLVGLELSGSLQYPLLPVEATLLAVNYLLLTGLMMVLSVLCLLHAFMRCDLRNVYRALIIAMGITGAFGMLESMVFAAPAPYLTPIKMMFMVTMPLLSALIALYTMARPELTAPAVDQEEPARLTTAGSNGGAGHSPEYGAR